MAIEAVILDVDGTLIDSNDAHAQAWVDVGKAHGIEIPFDVVRPMIGMGSDRVVPRLAGVEKDTPVGKKLADEHGVVFRRDYLPGLDAFDGTRELLERLRDDGLRLVVATSASREDMRAILDRAGVADLIDETTSSGDVEHSKPAPDVVEAALREAGAPPERVVMIGDTPYDVEACRRAGVRCIALRCGGWWRDQDLADAHAIYDDPRDLLEHYEESSLRS